MSETSFYSILGISEKASEDEIKKAYRKLSLKYHPDRNKDPAAAGTFIKISDAYETLGDASKRREYDMIHNNPFFKMANSMGGMGGMGAGDMRQGHRGPVPEGFADINDLFSELFGNPYTGPGPGPGQEIHLGRPGGGGGIRIFKSGHPIHINHGNGQGFAFGQAFGMGQALEKPTPIIKNVRITMEQVYNGANIPIVIERWIVENGTKVFEPETIYVKIPKGIDDNEIIVLREKGNIANEMCKGDIKIIIGVDNDSGFVRRGLDIIFEKAITLKESLCGLSFEIKHINGRTYTIHNQVGNIISPGFTKVISGLGLTRENDTGNLIIVFSVEYPEKLSPEVVIQLKAILS